MLPDDLTAYGMRPYDPPHPFILWPLSPVGISFCLPTLERNIEAARECVAHYEATKERERLRVEAEATKKRSRPRKRPAQVAGIEQAALDFEEPTQP